MEGRQAYRSSQDRPLNRSLDSLSLKEFFRARTISSMGWVILWLQVICMSIMLVIFVAPGWGWTQEIRGMEQFDGEMYGYYNIWYACWRLLGEQGPYGHMSCSLLSDFLLPSWVQGCQAMLVMAFVSALSSLIMSSIYVCSKTYNKNHWLVTGMSFTAGATALLMILVFIVWGVQYLNDARWCCGSGLVQIVQWRLWYCFAMAVASPPLYGAASITAVMELKNLKREARKRWEYQRRMQQQDMQFRQYEQMTEKEMKQWRQQYRPY